MSRIRYRSAEAADLAAIVRLIAADPIAAAREGAADPRSPALRDAFRAIAEDPNNDLIVADEAGTVVGVLQLTFIPGLTYQGGTRAQIEGVRVDRRKRGAGIGARMIAHAIDRARARDCALVQLTTDRRRRSAIAFYKELGFTPSHLGMKLWLK